MSMLPRNTNPIRRRVDINGSDRGFAVENYVSEEAAVELLIRVEL